MTIVFVAALQDYEDTEIVGVFTSRERAYAALERADALLGRKLELRIEEFELDREGGPRDDSSDDRGSGPGNTARNGSGK